ncbi:hypothetical protein [Sorangium sp. So ce388]|uniref:hypothetical protein n=1 Tax=Sorangium sp. So ce388 TaxID=3133309 RepID=UPI003F5C3986
MADQQPPPSAWEIAVKVKEILEARGYRAMATSSELGNMVQAVNTSGKLCGKVIGQLDGFTDAEKIADELETRLKT